MDRTTNPDVTVTACIIDTLSGEAYRYWTTTGPALVPDWRHRDAALDLLGELGVERHSDRRELIETAEVICLLELGRLLEPTDFELGELVDVHAFGRWYDGTVTKIGPKRITVHFVTGSGAAHDKAVNPAQHTTQFGSLVRKAALR